MTKKLARLIALLILGFCAGVVFGQSSVVTATITDSDSQTWNQGTWQVRLVGSPGYSGNYYVNGSSIGPATALTQSGTMSGSGVLTVTLASTNYIQPQGTSWQFILCPNASVPCQTVAPQSVTGATPNFSATLSALITAPRFPASGMNSFGYLDGEVSPTPQPGGQYYNVTSASCRQWTGSAWVSCGGGGGGATLPYPGLVYATSGTGGTVATAAQVGTLLSGASGCSTAGQSYNPATNTCTASGGGATLAYPGIVYGTSATASTVATPQQVGLVTTTGVVNATARTCGIQGDSYAIGNGPINPAGFNDPTLSWYNLIRPSLGLNCVNMAKGGFTSLDINLNQVMPSPFQPAVNTVFLTSTGFANDTQQYGNNSNDLLISTRAQQGIMFWISTPNSAKNMMQGCTQAGGFANSSRFFSGQGVTSTTSGATVSCSVTVGSSGVIEGQYMVFNGGTATFTVAVDGTTKTDPVSSSTTWITGGDGGQAVSTSYGTTAFAAGFRLTGFSAGTHTVLITQTAAGGTPTLDFEGVWGVPASSATNPIILGMDVPQLGSLITNYSYTSLYETIYTNIVTNILADGLYHYSVAARTLLGANTGTGNFNADEIHPSAAGSVAILGTPLAPSTSPAGTAIQEAYTAGIITDIPSFMNSLGGGQLNVPVGLDISQFPTDNPGQAQNTTGAAALAGGRVYAYGAANAIFSGLGYNLLSGSPESEVFGGFGSSAFMFCGWATPTGANNYVIAAAPTTCSAEFASSGQANLGINSSGQSAIQVSSNGTYLGYYGSQSVTVSSPMIFTNQTQATSGGNSNPPYLEFTSHYWNGSSSNNDSIYTQLQSGSGASPTTTFTWLRTGSNTGPLALNEAVYSGGATMPGLIAGGTTFTASGCGTPTGLVGGQTAGAFAAQATSCAAVVTPGITAPHGFTCWANDLTTNADTIHQTATTTTTLTLTGTVVIGDTINFGCEAY